MRSRCLAALSACVALTLGTLAQAQEGGRAEPFSVKERLEVFRPKSEILSEREQAVQELLRSEDKRNAFTWEEDFHKALLRDRPDLASLKPQRITDLHLDAIGRPSFKRQSAPGAGVENRTSPRVSLRVSLRQPQEIVREIVRADPKLAEAFRANPRLAESIADMLPTNARNLGDKSVIDIGAVVRAAIEAATKNVSLQVHYQGQQPVLDISRLPRSSLRNQGRLGAEREKPLGAKQEAKGKEIERNDVNTVLGRTYNSILRRIEVLHEMDVTVVKTLDGYRPDSRERSPLESYLKEFGVTDHSEVAASFDANSEVKVAILKKDVSLLRIFGGASKPVGRYLFCCLQDPARAPPALRERSGQFSSWADASGLATPPGNMQHDLAVVTLPKGTPVLVGTVADNFNSLGGNTQIFLPKPVAFAYKSYRLAESGAEATDFIALFEGGKLVRFRPYTDEPAPRREPK